MTSCGILSVPRHPLFREVWISFSGLIVFSLGFAAVYKEELYLYRAMVSTPDKSTRPVSAPIMSPVSPGDAAPSPVTSALPRCERREASTAAGRKSRSAERKAKEEAKVASRVESKVTEVSKTQSSRPQSTPEFKREGARGSSHHAPAVTTTNGTGRERKSQ
ncbi:unnamed protein product, partial [Coregonus sp. 'balchen']